VRDSVVNQLLAKMDGVVACPNVLVIGLTNRPELLDPALLRPGRLEVKLAVALPDRAGRREILRIHTRAMRENGALADDARALIDAEAGAEGARALPARTEHFSGAELAGLVRSAASFALARASLSLARADDGGGDRGERGGGGGEPLASAAVAVRGADFERALAEVVPSLGRRDEALLRRFAQHGGGGGDRGGGGGERGVDDGPRLLAPTAGHARAQRVLRLMVAGAADGGGAPARGRVRSTLLVGAGAGAGVTALGAWAAWLASSAGCVLFARLLSPLELLGQAEGEAARCAALAERFAEARAMGRAALVLDDVDRIVGGSAAVAATLRALVREPFEAAGAAAGARDGEINAPSAATPALLVIGTCSSAAAARSPSLAGIFESEAHIPLLATADEAEAALREASELRVVDVPALAALAMAAGPLGVKHLLELVDHACALARACAGDAELAATLGVRDAAALPLAELQLAALRVCCDDRRAGAA
jgi:vesicle-fusing ATPase